MTTTAFADGSLWVNPAKPKSTWRWSEQGKTFIINEPGRLSYLPMGDPEIDLLMPVDPGERVRFQRTKERQGREPGVTDYEYLWKMIADDAEEMFPGGKRNWLDHELMSRGAELQLEAGKVTGLTANWECIDAVAKAIGVLGQEYGRAKLPELMAATKPPEPRQPRKADNRYTKRYEAITDKAVEAGLDRATCLAHWGGVNPTPGEENFSDERLDAYEERLKELAAGVCTKGEAQYQDASGRVWCGIEAVEAMGAIKLVGEANIPWFMAQEQDYKDYLRMLEPADLETELAQLSPTSQMTEPEQTTSAPDATAQDAGSASESSSETTGEGPFCPICGNAFTWCETDDSNPEFRYQRFGHFEGGSCEHTIPPLNKAQDDKKPSKADAVLNESGLRVDPDIGMVMNLDWRLRRLGWTELPVCPEKLPADASKADKAEYKQALQEYEDKCDQVLNLILNIKAEAQRWRDAAEDRSKRNDQDAAMWEEFLGPLSDKLAAHRLTGKGQTMKLASGRISYTKSGGWVVAAFDEAKEEIRKKVSEHVRSTLAELAMTFGFDKPDVPDVVGAILEAIESVPAGYEVFVSEPTVSIDYQKFKGAVAEGKFEKHPGTAHYPENRFAKRKFDFPKPSKGGEDEAEGEA